MSNEKSKSTEQDNTEQNNNDCFVIMPITDPDGYEKGHFKCIYEDIFQKACKNAGLNPIRADDVNSTNLIHLDIIEKLVVSKLAICDLSSLNPNVLFELGIRQAFDMPTVLVREEKTPSIFDIAPLKYFTYRNRNNYREVLEDQKKLTDFLKKTLEETEKGNIVNSIISLLSMKQKATLKEGDFNDTNVVVNYLVEEINGLKSEIRNLGNFANIESISNKITLTKQSDEIYRNILHSIDELKEMISFGTPIVIVNRNWNQIKNQVLSIDDPIVRSALMRDLEELKSDSEKYEIFLK